VTTYLPVPLVRNAGNLDLLAAHRGAPAAAAVWQSPASSSAAAAAPRMRGTHASCSATAQQPHRPPTAPTYSFPQRKEPSGPAARWRKRPAVTDHLTYACRQTPSGAATKRAAGDSFAPPTHTAPAAPRRPVRVRPAGDVDLRCTDSRGGGGVGPRRGRRARVSAPLGRCKVCFARSHPSARVTKSATAARSRKAEGERPLPPPAGPLRPPDVALLPLTGASAQRQNTPHPSAGLAVTPPRLVRGCTPPVATQGAATPPPTPATGATNRDSPPRSTSRRTNHERRAGVECAEVGTPRSPAIPASPPPPLRRVQVATCTGASLATTGGTHDGLLGATEEGGGQERRSSWRPLARGERARPASWGGGGGALGRGGNLGWRQPR